MSLAFRTPIPRGITKRMPGKYINTLKVNSTAVNYFEPFI